MIHISLVIITAMLLIAVSTITYMDMLKIDRYEDLITTEDIFNSTATERIIRYEKMKKIYNMKRILCILLLGILILLIIKNIILTIIFYILSFFILKYSLYLVFCK